jgi:hypothetical protein
MFSDNVFPVRVLAHFNYLQYINYSAVEHYYEIYIFSMKILVISVRAAVGNGGQLLFAVKFAGNSEVNYILNTT